MTDNDRDIKLLLQHYQPVGPNAALRARVQAQARARSHWAFVEAAAATLLIGLNLVLICGSLQRVQRCRARRCSSLHSTSPRRSRRLICR